MTAYIIPLYIGPLRKKVKYKHCQYCLQNMGVCFEPFVINSPSKKCTDSIENIIKKKFDKWNIDTVIHFQDSTYLTLLNIKWYTISENPEQTDEEKKMRYYLNFYSPWFVENETVGNLYEIEVEDIEEEIDICTYVLDTCDNHHCYNSHLRNDKIILPDEKKTSITLYSILEHLITED